LQQTVITAPQCGRTTGLMLLAGECVAPGQSLVTLIGTDDWFIAARIGLSPGLHIRIASATDRCLKWGLGR
jgi:hypothetical protein